MNHRKQQTAAVWEGILARSVNLSETLTSYASNILSTHPLQHDQIYLR